MAAAGGCRAARRLLGLLLLLALLATRETAQDKQEEIMLVEAKMLFGMDSSDQQAQNIVRGVRFSSPELFMGTEELAEAQGFTVETHSVSTEDGYLLTLHHLVHSMPEEPGSNGGGAPVLMVHGILCASDLFLLTPRDHALAYLLADNGYDVWLANLRGNQYSRKHEILATNSEDFWKFSWHEMGVYDVPAFVDYVLEATAQSKLFYVAHSMGNTVYYVMQSERPEYNAKVRLHVGLAPAVFVGGLRTPPARALAPYSNNIVRTLEKAGTPELLPNSPARTAMLFLVCSGGGPCLQSYEITYGPAHSGLHESQIPFYVGHALQSTSVRTVGHFGQLISSGQFRQWDEGNEDANRQRYGQAQPPDYDLSNVTAPSAIFYSDDDFAVHPNDVERLAKEQKQVVKLFKVPDRPFNHMDFLFTPSAVGTLYEPILKLITLF